MSDKREAVFQAVQHVLDQFGVDQSDATKTLKDLLFSRTDTLNFLNGVAARLAHPPSGFKLLVNGTLTRKCWVTQVGALVDVIDAATVAV